MSDTVLSGRWTIYYGSENRQKRIVWTGGTAAADSVKSLYLALQDLFDELNQMDDGVPIKADTPTEYVIGIIDPGDKDPWFIDRTSTEHLKSGAIKSASWKRVQGSNVGIVKVQCSSTGFNIVTGDIGYDIVHDDGDSGTLLDVNTSTYEVWVRPDSYAIGNNFDSTSGTLTCNTHTATQTQASTTGEMLWANIYALGTLVDDSHLYVYQGSQTGDTAPDKIVTGYKTIWNWWGDGFFDILILVANQSSDLTSRSTFIDEGYISVLARQYKQTYTYYIVDLFAGGRNPIPLETGADLNNTTGWRTNTLSSSSGNWNVGNEIIGATSGARGKITATSGSNPTITLRYYLIGNTTVDFSNGETINNAEDTGTGTSGTPANYGPALLTGLSITHANNNSYDINEDGTNEYYSIVVDCSDEALANVYEWLKYQTRDGNSATTNTDGIEAEQYIGSDYRIVYTSITGTIPEGSVVTQVTSGAKGTVVAHHTTPKILILRNCRGTFNNTNNIEKDVSNYVTGPTCSAISPVKACPFGLFAGGVWFAALGIVPSNYLASEADKFQLVDDQGTVREVPPKVTVAISNTRIKDRIAIFRLLAAGGDLEKNYYAFDTITSIGGTSFSVDPVIRTTEPGKTTGGILFVVDTSAQVEHRYRYSSWTGDDFTLFNKAGDTAESGTDADTIVATGGFTNCLVGDIIYNSTRTAVTYISVKTSDDQVEVYPPITGQTNGDAFRVGACVAAYEVTNDKIYVPMIHVHEIAGTDGSPGSESVSVVYSADVPVRIRVRHANDTQYNIKPFETDGTIASGGLAVSTIRTPETITS